MRTQQDALYRAQATVDVGQTVTLAEAQHLVDEWRDQSWWPGRVQRVEVGVAAGSRSVGWFDGDKNAGRIELAPASRTMRTLVHELAHVFAEAIHDSKSHDPYYARIYGELIYRIMGSAAWLCLEEGYRREEVEYLA